MAQRHRFHADDNNRANAQLAAENLELLRTLAEVREVLDGLRSLGQSKPCWCRFTGNKEHSVACQRARALYEKLLVK